MKSQALSFKRGMYSYQLVPTSAIIWQIPALFARLEVTQVQFLGRLCRMNSRKGYPACPQMLQRHNDHNTHKPHKSRSRGIFQLLIWHEMNKLWLFMLIPFLCLCPLRLAIMLNFYTLKVAYWITEHRSAEQEVAGSNP